MNLNLGQRIGLSVLLGNAVMTSETTTSLAIKLVLMALSGLATYLHIVVPEAQLLQYATGLVGAGTLGYGLWRTFGMKLVPHASVAVAAPVRAGPDAIKVGDHVQVAGRVVGALVAALLLASMIPFAQAADLSTKAPVVIPAPGVNCDLSGCTGAYLGAQVSGSGTGINVLNLGALNAGGTYMGANAGYQFYNGTYFLGAGAQVEYQVGVAQGDVVSGFSNKLFAFEGVEFGGSLSNLFGIAALNLPAFLSTAVPTVKVGACQHGSQLSGYCAGAGAHFFVPNSRWTIDAEYLNAQYGSTQVSPTVTANTENRGSFGFSYHFN